MVQQADSERRRQRKEQAVAVRLIVVALPPQRQPDDPRGQQHVEAVLIRDDGLSPHCRAEAEDESGQRPDEGIAPHPRDEVGQQRATARRAHRRQQVHLVGGTAQGQDGGPQVTEQHIEWLAGRVDEGQQRRGILQFARIAADGARHQRAQIGDHQHAEHAERVDNGRLGEAIKQIILGHQISYGAVQSSRLDKDTFMPTHCVGREKNMVPVVVGIDIFVCI